MKMTVPGKRPVQGRGIPVVDAARIPQHGGGPSPPHPRSKYQYPIADFEAAEGEYYEIVKTTITGVLLAVKDRFPSWPYSFPPQHRISPFSVSAHV
jgi:hypothetical protein